MFMLKTGQLLPKQKLTTTQIQQIRTTLTPSNANITVPKNIGKSVREPNLTSSLDG